jgi:hypothetical protein
VVCLDLELGLFMLHAAIVVALEIYMLSDLAETSVNFHRVPQCYISEEKTLT